MLINDLDISVVETDPGPATAEVCVESGITGSIELELVVTLDITDGKAGKQFANQSRRWPNMKMCYFCVLKRLVTTTRI